MPAIKPVSYQVLVRVFEQDGFTFDRQRGDHLIYTKPDLRWQEYSTDSIWD